MICSSQIVLSNLLCMLSFFSSTVISWAQKNPDKVDTFTGKHTFLWEIYFNLNLNHNFDLILILYNAINRHNTGIIVRHNALWRPMFSYLFLEDYGNANLFWKCLVINQIMKYICQINLNTQRIWLTMYWKIHIYRRHTATEICRINI